MTNFLNPVSVFSAVLALVACAAAIHHVLRVGRLKRSLGAKFSGTAPAALSAGSSTRRVAALSVTGVATSATPRAAERHAVQVGALRVPALSGRDSQFDLSQLPLSAIYRRPGLTRGAVRSERRLAVVR